MVSCVSNINVLNFCLFLIYGNNDKISNTIIAILPREFLRGGAPVTKDFSFLTDSKKANINFQDPSILNALSELVDLLPIL